MNSSIGVLCLRGLLGRSPQANELYSLVVTFVTLPWSVRHPISPLMRAFWFLAVNK